MNVETNPGYYFRKKDDFPFPEIFDVKNVWDILEKKNEILRKIVIEKTTEFNNCIIKGPVFIGGGTEIRPFTCIIAGKDSPVYIGKNCKIGPHAYIRNSVLIGDSVEIGRTEVKGSVILNGTKSMHHGYIGDSVIGREVNIATSFDSGNLKHTGSNVRACGIETGRRKLGAIIGDYCKMGCKTTLYPGCMIGPNVWTDEGSVIKGFVPENTFLKMSIKYNMEKLREEYRKG